jgi:ERCC4-related helicase
VKLDNYEIFTTIPINPKILAIEHKFKLIQRKGISQVLVAVEEEEEEDSDKGGSEGSLVEDDDIISPPWSVASIDSI